MADTNHDDEAVSLRLMQEAVALWHYHEFPPSDNRVTNMQQQGLVLAEEAGEVCRTIVKAAQGIRGDGDYWDAELRKEAADVLIALCAVAQQAGFDLAVAVAERWETVRRRQFATRQARLSCECGHPWQVHVRRSMYPIPCRYCNCPAYAIDRTRIEVHIGSCGPSGEASDRDGGPGR